MASTARGARHPPFSSGAEPVPAACGFEQTEYQVESRSLVSLVNDLRQCGAQEHIQVPTVVVIGDQSSGKSSIIQRTCGVDLPRSNGTCTRCPMEVRLTDSQGSGSGDDGGQAWACRIKVCWAYDNDGSPIRPPVEDGFGQVISRKEDVELAVRRAQRAILNPGVPASTFLTADDSPGAANELKFSRNRVVLEVHGAPVNLTLVDLPGIIRSTDAEEDAHYVSLIRQLTIDYISKDETIIVLAIAANNDLDNQEVYALAKQADPQLQRTLGVLTKLDTVEPGCHDTWVSVLQGRKYKLALGWHAVKNPNKTDLDARITHKDATANERTFFSRSSPWSGLPLHVKDRLGVDALMQAMSRELTRCMKLQLPLMKATVDRLYGEAQALLDTLPAEVPESERRRLLPRLVRGLCQDITQAVTEPRDRVFEQQLRVGFSAFQKGVLVNRPRFELVPADEEGELGRVFDFAHHSGDADLSEQDLESEASLVLKMAEVKEIIQGEAGLAHVLNTRPYSAIVRVATLFQEGWQQPTMDCLHTVADLLSALVVEKTSKCMGRFAKLDRFVRLEASQLVERCVATSQKRLAELVEMDAAGPFTLNNQYIVESMAHFRGALNEELCTLGQAPHVKELQDRLTELGFSEGSKMELEMLLRAQDQSYDAGAVELVVSVMAYFRVSSTRFQDNVPRIIMLHLLNNFGWDLERHLLGALEEGHAPAASGTDGPSRGGADSGSDGVDVLDLMTENPVAQQRRRAVEARVKSLSGVRKVLFGL